MCLNITNKINRRDYLVVKREKRYDQNKLVKNY